MSDNRRLSGLESLENRLLLAADVIGHPVNDDTFAVHGTSDTDLIEFVAGTEEHILRLNGVEQRISASDFKNVRLYANGDGDTVRFTDLSTESEVFKSWSNKSELKGKEYFARADGFTFTDASATGANDKAYLYGSAEADQLVGSPTQVELVRGDGVTSKVGGFDRIYGYGKGGADNTLFLDGEGDDVFKSTSSYATLDSPESYIKVHGFPFVEAIASQGGYDKAYQYDTSGQDLLVISDERVRMLSEHRDSEAVGFERNYSYGSKHESDYVRVYDSVFSDDFSFDALMGETGKKNGFQASEDFVRLFSGDFYKRAEGFVVSEILEVNPRYLIGEVSETGAVDVNIEWEEGLTNTYYIEMQRYGAELIQAGLGTGNDDMVDSGIEVIQWGVDRQSADGSFENSGDAIHSTSLFLHSITLSVEELDRFGYDAFDTTIREQWVDSASRMADWMIANDDASRDVDLIPFSHRFFLRAVGLKRTAMLTGNEAFHQEADQYMADGIARLTEDGVLEERGGFDMNYQTLGLKYAGEFFRMTDDATTQDGIRSLFVASLSWISPRIDSDGNVDLSDSSRADEEARNGSTKSFDYKNAVRAYLSGYEITGDATWLGLADACFQHDSSSNET